MQVSNLVGQNKKKPYPYVSDGTVRSVKLRHFSGKLWAASADQQLDSTNKKVSEDPHRGKAQCTRRREQLTCPDMHSGKAQCLGAHRNGQLSVVSCESGW